MNIYAKDGDKVIFTNKGGYPHEQEAALEFLKVGETYTVLRTYVDRSSTKVFLREVPEEWFNSCQFEDSQDQMQKAASVDINCWWVYHKGICPNCHADMNAFHPAQNIANHFSGDCVKQGWVKEFLK